MPPQVAMRVVMIIILLAHYSRALIMRGASSLRSISTLDRLRSSTCSTRASCGSLLANPRESYHSVAGITTSEVAIRFDAPLSDRIHTKGGTVIILEATSESQEALVDVALESEDKSPAEDPYGAVLWPSSKLVGNTVLQKYSREELERMKIVELGTGTGLVSIICALAGCKSVVATDFNPLPLQMLEKAAALNGVDKDSIKTELFDVKAIESQRVPTCDLLLVADMLYDPATAVAVAKRVAEAVSKGSSVIVGDSPNRPGRPHFIACLTELLPDQPVEFSTVKGESVVGIRHDLISDHRSVDPVRSHELEMGLLIL